jgi:hypothetical protein
MRCSLVASAEKSVIFKPDAHISDWTKMSANGMVRPRSCPASDGSWQGAPKTRKHAMSRDIDTSTSRANEHFAMRQLTVAKRRDGSTTASTPSQRRGCFAPNTGHEGQQ